MKILHVHSGNMFGGVESALLSLHRGRSFLVGEQHFAVCFRKQLFEELKRHEATVHLLNSVQWRFPWQVWSARKKFRELLDRNHYDIIFFHNCWSLTLFGKIAATHTSHPKTVYLAHDVIRGNHWLEKWARKVPLDLILSNSRFVKEPTDRFFGVDSKVWYIPVFSPDSKHAADRFYVRQRMNCSENSFVIIQCGRLVSLKGHETLLRAVAEWKDHSNWECWIVGAAHSTSDRIYESGLRQLCDTLGITKHVRFLGSRRDVLDLLAASDVYCQPNIGEESFGLALIEALYAGLPVVTTNIGGPSEIVTEECGGTVPVNSPESVRRILEKALTNPSYRQKFSQTAPARARELCDPRNQLEKLGTILEGMLGRQRRSTAA